MDEYILAAVLRLDEAVTFVRIEPFNSATSHFSLHWQNITG
jgi:hypothetical protein